MLVGSLATDQANQRARAANSRRRPAKGGRVETEGRALGQHTGEPRRPVPRGAPRVGSAGLAGAALSCGHGITRHLLPSGGCAPAAAAPGLSGFADPCASLHPEPPQPHHTTNSVHAATSHPAWDSPSRVRKQASSRRPCVPMEVQRAGRQAWYASTKKHEAGSFTSVNSFYSFVNWS